MESLGRYQILGELGRGGCGVVYRALDPGIGRTVAIKTILTDAQSASGAALRERFRREARSAGILSHPNIVTIHDFSESGDIMFIAMEFIQGQTLGEKMAGSGPLPLDLVLPVVRGAADALDYAHANNIVHRDVKPANLMLTASGTVKVTDFGIAKMLDDEIGLTSTGMVIGTAQYMSPEQIAAKPATARSDQFSLAVIAYEMLTGQKPFQGNSWASVMHQIMSVDPPPVRQHRQDLGDEVTTVLRKALSKEPEARYASCREFADRLSHAVTGVTIERSMPMPISEAMKQPLPPPPRAERLAETLVMAATGSAGTPDTGQKLVAPLTAAAVPPPARPRSVLLPILTGVAVVVIVAAAAWRFTSHPNPAPAQAAPVADATPTATPAAPAAGSSAAPAPLSTSKTNAPAPPPRKEVSNSTAPPPATPAPVPVALAAAPVPAPIPGPVVATPPPAPAPKPAVAENVPAPAPAPVALPAAPPAPLATRSAEADEASRRAEEQRKAAAELSAGRRAVEDALNRYRTAFENKDSESLKTIWPSLGRAELNAFQNFFKIARGIKLQIQPLGEADMTATGATVRAHRAMTAADERGPLPQQDQIVRINLRRSANGMVIESIDIAGK
ncbi:MAG: serine/threonine protein kinase [Acidobacteriota bacterium]|nr:serine/threonine protein kinase [Acidobacteriota bacterium]